MLQIGSLQSFSHVYLYFADIEKGGPHMEIYTLRPHKPGPDKIYYFKDTDADNPIDRKKFFIDHDLTCQVEGKNYEITLMRGQPLDFMFKPSPTYALIKASLSSKIYHFFQERKRKSPPMDSQTYTEELD